MDRARIRRAAAAAVILVAPWCGCAGVKTLPALRVPKEEARQRLGTICVLPATAEFEFPEADSKLDTLGQLVQTRLEAQGFPVVPPAQSKNVFSEASAAVGGLYDPDTGERDREKYRQVKQEWYRRLHDQLGCDAVLTCRLEIVQANWTNGLAVWDGASDSVSDAFLGGFGALGNVAAVSLWIEIRDMNDQVVYFHTGGVQVIAKLESDFLKSRFELVAPEAVLADHKRVAHAVDVSLQALAPDVEVNEPEMQHFGGAPIERRRRTPGPAE